MHSRKLVWVSLPLCSQLGQFFATLRDIAVLILLWVRVTLLSVAVLVHFNTCCRSLCWSGATLQTGFDKLVQIAIQYRLGVTGFYAGA